MDNTIQQNAQNVLLTFICWIVIFLMDSINCGPTHFSPRGVTRMMIVLSSLQTTGIKDIIPLTDCYTFLSLPVQRIWLYINVSLREIFTYFSCSLLPRTEIAKRLLDTFLEVLFKMNSKRISISCTERYILINKSHLEINYSILIRLKPQKSLLNTTKLIYNI